MNKDLTNKSLSSKEIYNIMQGVLLREEKIDQGKERFWIIGFAQKCRLQFIELISQCSLEESSIAPMDVFRYAVMKDSKKVVLVHYYPNGKLNPSEIELDFADRMIQSGKILNVQVTDYMIISENSYMSFTNTGLLKKLELSTKWVP